MHRRDFLKAAGAGSAVLLTSPQDAEATPDSVQEQIKKIIGEKEQKQGRVSLVLPEIAENGSSVSTKISVESPMTTDDYVKAIHVFTDGNPLPDVASYFLGPQNGKAQVSLRIRLLRTQNVVAFAEMNNGDVYVGRKMIKVTIGGCGG
ncbi:MAG: thiosulfate oxidation carrier protein SoxY [Rhodospirillaceae bacterium]|nr:thiosulfate oxidation carrier protein SoxY [Rhodospirillaceae bacterium]MBT4463880.1 thiosulfate oxidation carrier protein SoxY [Rhodospirillaceae bacterium]MBT5013848.1 thiosulfate oxidation carrier protein SoxY [Rhodospirillaceae bacterium]MBT5307733.1 thiosulfate oxidation carrier protein SoxY [Rhodospirillaceae bacterium]MBT7354943.1 thiosulfate oxidation carrier protein SoxY [Rhodospirillaceae bacterium]